MDHVSEYEAVRQGVRPTGRVGIWGYFNGFVYDLMGSRGVDPSDQDYAASIDLNRYWKSEVEFNKIPNRLINDPLNNLDAAKGGPMVQNTTHDDGINYCSAYQDLRWNNDVTVPDLSLLTLHFNYRNQIRKGTYQARVVNHCSTCHIESEVRETDRETEEFRTGATLGNSVANIRYEFLNRELTERAQTPLHVYDEVRHPVNLKRVFTNRAQFEGMDGPIPFDQTPNFKKNRHYVRGFVSIPKGGGEVVGTFVDDRLDNSGYGYGVQSQVASGYYAVKLGERFSLNLKARNLDIDSDTIFIDVNDRIADAGPQAGKTYKEIYTDFGEADFLQSSSLQRDIFDFNADGRFLLAPKSVIRFGYEYEKVKRPQYEIAETQTNRIKLGFSSRPTDSFTARLRYQHADSDIPFAHVHAALSPVLQPEPSPGNSPFTGLQYFTIYRTRQVDLSNYPAKAHELRASATWSPSDRMSLTAHFRVDKDSNVKLNELGKWSDSIISPSLELWFAPSERVDLMASYTHHQRETDTLFGIAVYDG